MTRYRYARGEYEYEESPADGLNPTCTDPEDTGCVTLRTPLDLPLMRKSWIDAEYTNDTVTPKVCNSKSTS